MPGGPAPTGRSIRVIPRCFNRCEPAFGRDLVDSVAVSASHVLPERLGHWPHWPHVFTRASRPLASPRCGARGRHGLRDRLVEGRYRGSWCCRCSCARVARARRRDEEREDRGLDFPVAPYPDVTRPAPGWGASARLGGRRELLLFPLGDAVNGRGRIGYGGPGGRFYPAPQDRVSPPEAVHRALCLCRPSWGIRVSRNSYQSTHSRGSFIWRSGRKELAIAFWSRLSSVRRSSDALDSGCPTI